MLKKVYINLNKNPTVSTKLKNITKINLKLKKLKTSNVLVLLLYPSLVLRTGVSSFMKRDSRVNNRPSPTGPTIYITQIHILSLVMSQASKWALVGPLFPTCSLNLCCKLQCWKVIQLCLYHSINIILEYLWNNRLERRECILNLNHCHP